MQKKDIKIYDIEKITTENMVYIMIKMGKWIRKKLL